ncbi:DNA methylase [Vibrio crassostreae]|uniref:DNA methyltransferase n=1 Tax=Vibrio crassostreae TaxID=246167 RepID=UPI001047B96C|nr:DNA methyltransferase [Vibrio crassostreae]TCN74252.1 DNA methylase [Vibrio crassostreae]
MKQENLFDTEGENKASGPVECLGMTFESDEARRAHFTDLLRDKLKDPEFRAIEGFPIGTDEAILELSDPPYYTACPNPWLNEFVCRWESSKHRVISNEKAKPYSADVSVGKTDSLYRAHSYHTKVPHKAIVPALLNYTKPGDIVLDAFSGTGMTALAAQYCENPPKQFRDEVESNWPEKAPEWGARKAIANDLSPVATFIASGYNLPVDPDLVLEEGEKILRVLDQELGWMYETKHLDDQGFGQIDYMVWSQVFSCPECAGEISFYDHGIDQETKRVNKLIVCPNCSSSATKRELKKVVVSYYDELLAQVIEKPKRVPALISYKYQGVRYQKKPDSNDLEVLKRVSEIALSDNVPHELIPKMHMTHERARMDYSGVTHIHHFFKRRALLSINRMWELAQEVEDNNVKRVIKFWLEQSIWSMSLMNKYEPIQFGRADGSASQVGRFMKGVYYISSLHTECSPNYVNFGKLKRIVKAFKGSSITYGDAIINCGSATHLTLHNHSVDYIFTDPPFGENIYYSDLNYLIESFHGVETNAVSEAIVDRCKNKDLYKYQSLMQDSFSEYYRVLKPGKWITIVFSNSKASVWNAIQVSLQQAGFVVAEVTALDKKQGSYRQVTSTTAVKQDLVISAYKPDIKRDLTPSGSLFTDSDYVSFLENHLSYLPIYKVANGQLVTLPERTAKVLFDRCVAWFVKNQVSVSVSVPEFQKTLNKYFVERDEQFYLSEQAVQYDRKIAQYGSPTQLDIFVDDEQSLVNWLSTKLRKKPETIQDIQPDFLKELKSWKKYEKSCELIEVLELNFLKFDGKEEVPSQIHTYLSTNFKGMRGLSKDDPKLVAKAKDRWYVPDPNKAADLEKVRLRALLKEFETYKAEKKKIKQPRAEALRAGFNTAWEAQDFQTILDISAKIPPAVLQEDEKLLMFYDNALTLTTTEDDEW